MDDVFLFFAHAKKDGAKRPRALPLCKGEPAVNAVTIWRGGVGY